MGGWLIVRVRHCLVFLGIGSDQLGAMCHGGARNLCVLLTIGKNYLVDERGLAKDNRTFGSVSLYGYAHNELRLPQGGDLPAQLQLMSETVSSHNDQPPIQ